MRIRKRGTPAEPGERTGAGRARAAPPRAGASGEPASASGLAGFAIHATQKGARAKLAKATSPRGGVRRGIAAATAPVKLKDLDPETAAQRHLDDALASDALAAFNRPRIESAESEFKSLGSEAITLAGTTVVKFRQYFNKVPVYGSLVTVELDRANECLGINSSLGTPTGVNHIARISPAGAVESAAEAAGVAAAAITQTPRLYYYFDQAGRAWRLAYIIEDVTVPPRPGDRVRPGPVRLRDFVVDAHSGKLLAELPRVAGASKVEMVVDANGRRRRITVQAEGSKRRLRDETLNVTTCSFDFRDPSAHAHALPGPVYEKPPKPWPPEAIGAHANGSEVARFLRKVVLRNNIDARGGEMISSVNCWDHEDGDIPPRQWKNAYWNGEQMVYGQILFPDGSFYSVASMLDVVGHEMFHGVTDHTSRLEYVTQSGALNESYSDIFGVLVANYRKPIRDWEWRIGLGFEGPGEPLRDMSDPRRCGQPRHMDEYLRSTPPYTYSRNDYGHVHDNSGIHNYAAYRVMTAKSGARYLFTARELAAMFYIALTTHLSRTSQFGDSRRGVLQVARSLFRNESAASQAKKVRAVEKGFDAAGID